jgi:hypothetical protein
MRQKAFARWLGVSPTVVGRYLAAGHLHPPALRADGLLDTAEALAQLCQAGIVAEGAAARPELAADADSLEEARRRELTARASLRELELRVQRGELINIRQAEAVIFRAGREIRDTVQARPARVAATMAAQLGIDAGTLLRALEASTRELLEELAVEPAEAEG